MDDKGLNFNPSGELNAENQFRSNVPDAVLFAVGAILFVVTEFVLFAAATPAGIITSQLVLYPNRFRMAVTTTCTDRTTPAWFDPSATVPAPIGDFADVDVVYDAAGNEKARRPNLVRRSNLNELHPIKLGKRLPANDALTAFAFKQT